MKSSYLICIHSRFIPSILLILHNISMNMWKKPPTTATYFLSCTSVYPTTHSNGFFRLPLGRIGIIFPSSVQSQSPTVGSWLRLPIYPIITKFSSGYSFFISLTVIYWIFPWLRTSVKNPGFPAWIFTWKNIFITFTIQPLAATYDPFSPMQIYYGFCRLAVLLS